MEYKRIAIDTSKHVFTLHGVDDQERTVLRRELRRAQMDAFFAKLPPTEVVLEACGGSHHWGRVLGAQGHRAAHRAHFGVDRRATGFHLRAPMPIVWIPNLRVPDAWVSGV